MDNINNEDIDDEDGVANDSEIIETIHDDYNYSNNNIVIDETEDSSTVSDNTTNTTAVVDKLGLCNIFNCGHKKTVEMKIPEVRERKQNRMKRSENFLLSVHNMVIYTEQHVVLELNRYDNTMIPNTWFRQTHRTVLNCTLMGLPYYFPC